MKKKFLSVLALGLLLVPMGGLLIQAQEKAAPSLDQRVADLEAYVNNGARGADTAD